MKKCEKQLSRSHNPLEIGCPLEKLGREPKFSLLVETSKVSSTPIRSSFAIEFEQPKATSP